MTQQEALKLFEAIKNDDVAGFKSFVEEYKKLLHVTFGRFPILSTCYLFSSSKILMCFEKQMLQTDGEFVTTYEPFELYNFFKQKSERCLRLFACKEQKISPMEMLAVLGRDKKVAKLYKMALKGKILNVSADHKQILMQNLEKIYTLKNQKILFLENNVKISFKPLSKKQKRIALASVAASLLIVLICSVACWLWVQTYGLGTSDNPKKIYNQHQLESLKNNPNFFATIMNNFEISSCSLEKFSGHIDGNGKTIAITHSPTSAIFQDFSGTIKNLTIAANNVNFTTNGSFCLLAQKNSGSIENVAAVFTGNVVVDNQDSTAYFCVFAQTNSGSIVNCSAQINANISSSSSKDVHASAFVATNTGTISNCTIVPGSKVCATNVSFAGFAVQSYASISNCTNNAIVEQTTTLANFSPAVAGVTLVNFGTISNSQNLGNLSISDLTETSGNINSYIAGICVENYTTIEHCKNVGDIAVCTNNKQIYAGGICAHAPYNYSPQIVNCGTIGNFDIQKQSSSTTAYCGAFAGFLEGTISNSFSISTFTQGYDKENLFIIGLAVGQSSIRSVSIFFPQYYVNLSIVASLTSPSSNVSRPLASSYEDYTTFDPDLTVCSKEDIENSSIYF